VTELPHLLIESLEGKYELEHEIGRGGMATVFRARDLRHDRLVAIKIMHPELALALGRERFLREIRLAAGLQHPNIVAVHDSGEANGLLYYVMPFVEGETLRHRLEREKRLSVDDALRIAHEITDALGYAHARGIVHRDVKPENILLADTGHALVADFGIARAAQLAREDRLTVTGVSLGTPAYMAPEQALGEDTDARADVWALGCMLFEMLAGDPPFGRDQRQVLTRSLTEAAPSLRNQRPDVPHFMSDAVQRALARSPDGRFPDAGQFGAALAGREAPRRGRSKPRLSPRARPVMVGAFLIVGGAAAALWTLPAAKHLFGGSHRSHLSSDSLANELYRQGRTLITRRTLADYQRAFDLFSQAIARDSNFARAWAGLARDEQLSQVRGFAIHGLSRDSLVARAVQASRRAVELDPDDPESWIATAHVAQMVDPAGRSGVITAARHALALDSTSIESSEAWFELGLAHSELLNDSLAEREWLRAVAVDATNVQALSFLSGHYRWVGQADRAAIYADSAVALDPVFVVARESAWQAAAARGRWDEVERHASALERSAMGQPQEFAIAGLVRARLGRGDSAAARALLRQAVAVFDSTKPTLHQAAYIGASLAAVGDTASAVRWLEAYRPREDLHFQLHIKRDDGLRWTAGRWGRGVRMPDPESK
jgi:tRNA A-37 threonylcarbamoyl transferase component Bud32/tetratricopeptide (TPR) repeat protein